LPPRTVANSGKQETPPSNPRRQKQKQKQKQKQNRPRRQQHPLDILLAY
jgi:hypothetical protein